MLLLGFTKRVMRTSNRNSGVAPVAAVTIAKLVVPLKVLNMDNNELSLMKEIVLFNPDQQSVTHHHQDLVSKEPCSWDRTGLSKAVVN